MKKIRTRKIYKTGYIHNTTSNSAIIRIIEKRTRSFFDVVIPIEYINTQYIGDPVILELSDNDINAKPLQNKKDGAFITKLKSILGIKS